MKIPNEGPVILKFSAEWCFPCRALKPLFEELKEENEDVTFLDIDVDENKALATEYGVRSIPFVIFMRDGEVTSTVVGTKTKSDYQEEINLPLE